MNDATTSLNELDHELRRHISRLLEITGSDGRVTHLIYDAIQHAARTGQACRRLQNELAPMQDELVPTGADGTCDAH